MNEGSEPDSLDDAGDGETGKSLSHIHITIPGPRPLGKTSCLLQDKQDVRERIEFHRNGKRIFFTKNGIME